jgi:methylated-DNA-[protein]-cysteine S-methyltransferase
MKDKISTHLYSSPYGDLLLGSFEDRICMCDWWNRTKRSAIDKRLKEGLNADFIQNKSAIIERAIEQLNEYFFEQRTAFTIPLIMIGSTFQKTVWEQLPSIPHGSTISYYQLAEKVKNTKAIRAVSSANGANAISIFIPCHRVIGSYGALTGYAGGLTCKQQLLELEATTVQTKLF